MEKKKQEHKEKQKPVIRKGVHKVSGHFTGGSFKGPLQIRGAK